MHSAILVSQASLSAEILVRFINKKNPRGANLIDIVNKTRRRQRRRPFPQLTNQNWTMNNRVEILSWIIPQQKKKKILEVIHSLEMQDHSKLP